MIYEVTVKGINANIEEEITIEVNKITLTCFAQFGYPATLNIGDKCKVDLNVTILDDFYLKEIEKIESTFERINNSFSYFIRGKFDFNSHKLDAGIKIMFDEDDFDLNDFAYLDGKNSEIRADRIKIEFLE